MPLAHWLRVTTCGSGAAVVGADDVGDVEPGDAGEVGEGQAHGRVDVRPPAPRRWRRAGRTGGRRPSSAGPGRRAPWPGRRTSAATENGVVRPFLGAGVVGHGSDATGRPQRSAVRARRTVAAWRSPRPPSRRGEPPSRVHVTGAEGSLGPPRARPARRRPAASSTARRRRPTSSSTSAPATTTCGPAAGRTSPTGAAAMLDDATAGDASHLVLVSSAMVYGAYANNPVPLTEDAILRPDVDFVYARQLATVEAMADRWRRAAPGPHRHRAAPGRGDGRRRHVVAGRARSPPGSASASARRTRRRSSSTSTTSPSAVALAVDRRLDGVFNVAPDGWVAGERVRALTGARPRIRLPDRVAEVVAAVRWRFQRGPIPPGLRSYTRAPWLVANDRLKAAGLAPDGHQRAGLRRGHRGAVVDDDHAEAAPGAVARRRWRVAGARRGRSASSAWRGGGGAAAADVTAVAGAVVVGAVGRRRRRRRRRRGRRRRSVGAASWSASTVVVGRRCVVVDRRDGGRGRRRRRRSWTSSAASPGIVDTVISGDAVGARSVHSPTSVAVVVEDRRRPRRRRASASVDHRHDLRSGRRGRARCRSGAGLVVGQLGSRAVSRRQRHDASARRRRRVRDDLDLDHVARRAAGRHRPGRSADRRRHVVTAQPSSPSGVTIGSARLLERRADAGAPAQPGRSSTATGVGRRATGPASSAMASSADQEQAERRRRDDQHPAAGRRRLVRRGPELGRMAPRTLVRRQRGPVHGGAA